ncbi:hypothetical protein GCM10022243_08270 [Saccharothrix violaceirubra]|uniref:Uncharacterized protein n=1 Tax=Saccharothrix violaceirubra TaxID=413306 RepID=A0A7W7SYI6_9PSEU|nr:hypothetical protein [Saccharothrix violaceirubra]MBB4963239.1 hypothetical protein [Saccharothrix violaceirubra]
MNRKVYIGLALLGVVLVPAAGVLSKSEHFGWSGQVGLAYGATVFPVALFMISRRVWPAVVGFVVGIVVGQVGLAFGLPLWLDLNAGTVSDCRVVEQRALSPRVGDVVTTVDCAGERFEIVPFRETSAYAVQVGSTTDLVVDRTGLIQPLLSFDVRPGEVTWPLPVAAVLPLALVLLSLRRRPTVGPPAAVP